jgi:dienelactone hydrolase
MVRAIILGVFASLIPVWTWAAIVGEEVSYGAGDRIMKGYLAYDDAGTDKRPGVLVVHEWWGHNEYARKRARMLAEQGYVALAVDMYGDGKQAHHPDEAGKFSGEVGKNLPLAKERFAAARKVLADHKRVDPSRIAAMGYCFGGGVVLEMARQGIDLKAVGSFHGSLGTAQPARLGVVKAKIFVAHGAEDPFTTAEQIATFKSEMTAAKVSYDFVSYPGAKHGFTNPDSDQWGQKFNMPLAYHAEADKQSWSAWLTLLNGVFAAK